MNNSPPDPVAKSPSTAGGPIAKEVAEWLKSVREGWTHPLPEPEGWRQSLPKPPGRLFRGFIAGTGTFTWLVGVLLFALSAEPRFANFVSVEVTSNAVFAVLSVVFPGVALWFGWIIAYVPRRSGPIRLFLEGLLLPTATVTIIGLSMGRMPFAPREFAPIPENRPDGAQTVAGSGLYELPTGAESTSGEPLLSDGGRQ